MKTTYSVGEKIIDQDGRVGVVTNVRPYDDDCIWVRPENLGYKTQHEIPGLGSQITITATHWHIQPDGTLIGDWFDRQNGHINDKTAKKLKATN